MSIRYGEGNPDADAWYDPADGAVYAGGETVDEALAQRQRREQQDREVADIVRIDSKRPAEPSRRVAWRKASGIAVKRRTWLWADRVPLGETTPFVGHAGVGKSQGAAWLSVQVTRGGLPGELEGQPCPVMYVATEDSWEYTLAPRLLAAGADMDRVLAVHTETRIGNDIAVGTLSLAVDVPSLRDAVEATGTRVIVIDALLSAMTGSDLMKQGVVRSLLEPLSALAQDRELAIIGIAHFRKSAGADPLLLISGSAEYGQVVRSAIGFVRDPESEDASCVMSLIKSNIAPMGTPSLRYVITPASVEADDGQLTSVGRFELVGESEQSVSELLNQAPAHNPHQDQIQQA